MLKNLPPFNRKFASPKLKIQWYIENPMIILIGLANLSNYEIPIFETIHDLRGLVLTGLTSRRELFFECGVQEV